MKITLQTAFAAVTLFTLMPCTPPVRAQDAAKTSQPVAYQLQAQQGSWEGVEVGREAQGKCTMTISGNSIHFQGSNKNEWYKATFTLALETDPKQLRATITDCPSPDYVGKVAFAIFKLEEGTFTLVGHAPGAPEAPKTFEGDATSRSFVFKKVAAQKNDASASKSE